MQHHQNGFTLVELAIALMIIGLLIGGVLKGQELIENARITRIAKNTTDYDTAVMIFRNTYNALPGDVRRPSRIPNCTGECAVTDANTGNGNLTSPKGRVFWIHMERAGVISGIHEDPTDTSATCISPINAFDAHDMVVHMINSTAAIYRLEGGNLFTIFDSNGPPAGAVPCNISHPRGKRIAALDQKLDDGRPYTGTVRVRFEPQCTNVAEDEYDTTSPAGICRNYIRLGSMN